MNIIGKIPAAEHEERPGKPFTRTTERERNVPDVHPEENDRRSNRDIRIYTAERAQKR